MCRAPCIIRTWGESQGRLLELDGSFPNKSAETARQPGNSQRHTHTSFRNLLFSLRKAAPRRFRWWNFAFLPPHPPAWKTRWIFGGKFSFMFSQGKKAYILSLPKPPKFSPHFPRQGKKFITWSSLWGRLHVTFPKLFIRSSRFGACLLVVHVWGSSNMLSEQLLSMFFLTMLVRVKQTTPRLADFRQEIVSFLWTTSWDLVDIRSF